MRVEAEPGKPLQDVWVYLSPDEARHLLAALEYWEEEDPPDPEWHTHITDEGREFTIAIETTD